MLDRYVLAKTRRLVEDVTAAMENYDLAAATAYISSFLDALTNWYVRRSSDRFWRPVDASSPGARPVDASRAGAGPVDDKQDAYDTLHTVLEVLSRVAAPFLPVSQRSRLPRPDRRTERSPDGLARSRRAAIRPRSCRSDGPGPRRVLGRATPSGRLPGDGRGLPLSKLTVAAPGATRLLPFAELIADEVNVQQVELLDEVGERAETVLSVVPAALGPRLGQETQHVIAAARKGSWSRVSDGTVEVGGVALREGEFELRLRPRDQDSSRALPGDLGIVTLDLETTAELEAEGLARDVIRHVQRARRDAGLHVTDRIRLVVVLPHELVPVFEQWQAHIASQVLALELAIEAGAPATPEHLDPTDGTFTSVGELSDGNSVVLRIKRLD